MRQPGGHRPSQRRWRLAPAWSGTCPRSTGPPDPWAPTSHAPGISAKETEPCLVAGRHLRGCKSKSARVLGPFPQRPQNLPLIFPSSTHGFTPESLTIPHPLTPPSICSCLWLLKPPRLSRCSSGDHNSPQNESLGVPMAPCSYQQIDMIPLFYAVLYRMSR